MSEDVCTAHQLHSRSSSWVTSLERLLSKRPSIIRLTFFEDHQKVVFEEVNVDALNLCFGKTLPDRREIVEWLYYSKMADVKDLYGIGIKGIEKIERVFLCNTGIDWPIA